MPEVLHESIGERTRKIEITEEAAELRKKELIDRFTATPWGTYGIDQLSLWAVWATLAVSVFLFCTVSAVMLAVR